MGVCIDWTRLGGRGSCRAKPTLSARGSAGASPSRLLLALLIAVVPSTAAQAQFGPAKVVVNKVIERPVAPVQTFVASVSPLRKSVVGSAVNGRVEEFLPHTALAYGKEMTNEEDERKYRVRLANFDVAVAAANRTAAIAAAQAKLQERVAEMTHSEISVLWTKQAQPPKNDEEEFWIIYRPDESKLIQVRRGQPLAMLREGTIRIRIDAAAALRDLRQAEHKEEVETHDGKVEDANEFLRAATKKQGFAAAQYARNQQLYNNNRSISRQELDASATAAAEADQQYVQAKIAAEYIKRGDRITQSKARLAEAEALLRELKDRLEKYVIRAPFDGFVVAEHTEVGAWIREGEPVAEVVQLHPVEVRAFVSEKYVTQLQIGGPAIVRPNIPLAEDHPAPVGRITGIIAEAVTRSRTFPVRIQVDNADHFLKAGMLAKVELEVGPKKRMTLVPKDALYFDRSYPHPQIFLAVTDEKDSDKTRPLKIAVETGAALGNWIAVEAVKGKINEGDKVVEKGNERISPATKELIPTEQGATPPPN